MTLNQGMTRHEVIRGCIASDFESVSTIMRRSTLHQIQISGLFNISSFPKYVDPSLHWIKNKLYASDQVNKTVEFSKVRPPRQSGRACTAWPRTMQILTAVQGSSYRGQHSSMDPPTAWFILRLLLCMLTKGY